MYVCVQNSCLETQISKDLFFREEIFRTLFWFKNLQYTKELIGID